jgi:hypothetical protein
MSAIGVIGALVIASIGVGLAFCALHIMDREHALVAEWQAFVAFLWGSR